MDRLHDLNVSRDARTVQLALSIVLRCPPVMFEAIDGENGGSTLLERIYLSSSGNPILAKPSACSKRQALLADPVGVSHSLVRQYLGESILLRLAQRLVPTPRGVSRAWGELHPTITLADFSFISLISIWSARGYSRDKVRPDLNTQYSDKITYTDV